MIKMIVTDLDDTLLKKERSVSEFTRETFAGCRERGILTAFATARVAIGATQEQAPVPVDIKIVSNGAMALCGERELFFCGIGLERANRFLVCLKSCGARDILVSCRQETYWESDRIATSPVLYRAVWNDFSKPIERDADQICFLMTDPDVVERLKKEFGDLSWITYRDGSHAVVQKGVSKLSGIERVAALYGLELSEIAAFGDDAGDCEMLRRCGLGVAVGNALEQAKEAADYLTASNEEDGVARFIREFIWQQGLDQTF